MDEKIKEHLNNALEAYTAQLANVNQFVDGMEPQLAKALEHRTEIELKISEVREVLGMTDEEPEPEETETTETNATAEETVST